MKTSKKHKKRYKQKLFVVEIVFRGPGEEEEAVGGEFVSIGSYCNDYNLLMAMGVVEDIFCCLVKEMEISVNKGAPDIMEGIIPGLLWQPRTDS